MKKMCKVILACVLLVHASVILSLPIPSAYYQNSDLQTELYSGGPFSELSWQSWIYTLYELISDKIGSSINTELSNWHSHILSAGLVTFLHNLQNYMVAILWYSNNIPSDHFKRAWGLYVNIQVIITALNIVSVLSPLMEEPNELPTEPDRIKFDSILLNSLFTLRSDNPDLRLHIQIHPWITPPELNSQASILARHLIHFHNLMSSLQLDDCLLTREINDYLEPIIQFQCQGQDVIHSGRLRLFSHYGSSYEPDNHPVFCPVSFLQSDIIHCLDTALESIDEAGQSGEIDMPCISNRQYIVQSEALRPAPRSHIYK